jgi:6-phosphofructokinase 1
MPSSKIHRIGVLTSGGDAPGMNACVRAVVRSAINMGGEAVGILGGYEGLIEGLFRPLAAHDVSNIIQRGGTILKSARCPRFHEAEWRKVAKARLSEAGIDALVVIGGDGTFTGAKIFGEEHYFPIIGTPGTIDNDLYGTDFTIGYDTALNTALEAIDRIRDTADSHNRLFFIEVMGRDAGFIALNTGIAGGAEGILIPESKTDIDGLVKHLENGHITHSSSIVVVAEGDDEGGALEIAAKVKERFDKYDTRVTIIGHIQRGGAPTCADRVLATRVGVAAVKGLHEGRRACMAGIQNRDVVYTPFEQAIKHHQAMNPSLLELARTLSCYF